MDEVLQLAVGASSCGKVRRVALQIDMSIMNFQTSVTKAYSEDSGGSMDVRGKG